MRRCISLIALSVLVTGNIVTFYTSAKATDSWYISGNTGASNFAAKATSFQRYGHASPGKNSSPVNGRIVGLKNNYVSGSLGYSWDRFRIEGELSYRKSDFSNVKLVSANIPLQNRSYLFYGISGNDDGWYVLNYGIQLQGSIRSIDLMANIWYDFDTGTNWTPYVGGGIGGSRQKLEITSVDYRNISYKPNAESVLTYQGGLGIYYNSTKNTSINLGYRYRVSDRAEFDDSIDKVRLKYASHILTIGMPLNF